MHLANVVFPPNMSMIYISFISLKALLKYIFLRKNEKSNFAFTDYIMCLYIDYVSTFSKFCVSYF